MEKSVFHEPTPEVIFKGFMDNSLGFELWVWVNRIDREPQIKSSLNFIIEYNLRQQGINIPFPQLDLWFRNPEVFTSSLISRSNGQDMLQRERVHNGQDTPQRVQQELPKQASKPLAIRDLLKQVTYFHNFTDIELRQLIEIGYRKRLTDSSILFREGDPGDAFYIILSGSVEVFVEKIDKQLTTLQTGNFFGELSLMLGIPRTASVRALEDTILFVINNKGFEKLLHEQPELAEVIIEELGKHQEELSERQEQLRAMGLVDAAEDDKNPVAWVRKRLKNLFSL
jgi:CRP-like cAMP-binding protein